MSFETEQKMSGLIVRQPFATDIILGEKEWEERSRYPPSQYRNRSILLLSQGYALGIIKIIDVKANEIVGAKWKIRVIKEFDEPVKYAHKGQQVWVKNVKLEKNFFGEWNKIISNLKFVG